MMVSGALAPGVMAPSAELAAAELPVLAAEASGVTCHVERSPCQFRSGVAPGFLSEAVTTWGQPQDCPHRTPLVESVPSVMAYECICRSNLISLRPQNSLLMGLQRRI